MCRKTLGNLAISEFSAMVSCALFELKIIIIIIIKQFFPPLRNVLESPHSIGQSYLPPTPSHLLPTAAHIRLGDTHRFAKSNWRDLPALIRKRSNRIIGVGLLNMYIQIVVRSWLVKKKICMKIARCASNSFAKVLSSCSILHKVTEVAGC